MIGTRDGAAYTRVQRLQYAVAVSYHDCARAWPRGRRDACDDAPRALFASASSWRCVVAHHGFNAVSDGGAAALTGRYRNGRSRYETRESAEEKAGGDGKWESA